MWVEKNDPFFLIGLGIKNYELEKRSFPSIDSILFRQRIFHLLLFPLLDGISYQRASFRSFLEEK